MWICSKTYGLSNTNFMEQIVEDRNAFQLYGVFDGNRRPICDDERDFDKVRNALEKNFSYVEVN